MRHNIATVKTPKMSKFKMGLSKSNKTFKRLDTEFNQTVRIADKVIRTAIDYVYTHNDGSLTGSAIISGKKVDVKRVAITKTMERSTIRGTVKQVVVLGHYWEPVR